MRLRRPVVMIGMMGAGKTAVGRALAARLGAPFADSDDALVTAAGMPIADIFARDGEAFFREKEAQVIERLLTDDMPSVLSVGGGAYLRAETRDLIAAHGVAVWLDAPLDVLWERVRHKDTRPLLRTDDPKATLAALLQDRRADYAKAPIHVPSDAEVSIEEMATRVIAALRDTPDMLDTAP
ncbi:MAG: shikimate kinase [Shimia sp.]